MNLNNLNKKQTRAYDALCSRIRGCLGSYHSMSLQIHLQSGQEIHGETLRAWFVERRIPTDYCFILYELMGRGFDIFTLLPWLDDFVTMKNGSGASN